MRSNQKRKNVENYIRIFENILMLSKTSLVRSATFEVILIVLLDIWIPVPYMLIAIVVY